MTMSTAFETFNADAHFAAINQGNRAVRGHSGTHASVKCVQILAITDVDLQSMSLQSTGHIKALQII